MGVQSPSIETVLFESGVFAGRAGVADPPVDPTNGSIVAAVLGPQQLDAVRSDSKTYVFAGNRFGRHCGVWFASPPRRRKDKRVSLLSVLV